MERPESVGLRGRHARGVEFEEHAKNPGPALKSGRVPHRESVLLRKGRVGAGLE
jgi:hypothetical protein